MKTKARSYFWWPEIENNKKCEPCNKSRLSPPKAAIIEYEPAKHIFELVHVDFFVHLGVICRFFFGPFTSKMFLVLLDACSKWPEVLEVQLVTASVTIDALRTIFTRFGVPNQIVLDNGTQFSSDKFSFFLRRTE